jgi:hypothetical protein
MPCSRLARVAPNASGGSIGPNRVRGALERPCQCRRGRRIHQGEVCLHADDRSEPPSLGLHPPQIANQRGQLHGPAGLAQVMRQETPQVAGVGRQPPPGPRTVVAATVGQQSTGGVDQPPVQRRPVLGAAAAAQAGAQHVMQHEPGAGPIETDVGDQAEPHELLAHALDPAAGPQRDDADHSRLWRSERRMNPHNRE